MINLNHKVILSLKAVIIKIKLELVEWAKHKECTLQCPFYFLFKNTNWANKRTSISQEKFIRVTKIICFEVANNQNTQ